MLEIIYIKITKYGLLLIRFMSNMLNFGVKNHTIMLKQTITFDRFIRIVTGILLIALAYFLIRKLSGVLIPFFIAWLMAYMLYPFVKFLEKKFHIKYRILSIILVLLALIAILTGACLLIIPPVIDECARLKDIVVNYVNTSQTTTAITAEVENFIKHNIDIKEVTKALTIKDISSLIEERVPQLFSIIYDSVDFVIGMIGSLVTLMYLFFILMDYEQISKGFIKMVPPTKRGFVSTVLHDVENGMNGYFRGQSLIAFIVGILFAIGFLIIGLPLAIPLGLFIGFLNLVPYLQTLGFIPAIMLGLLKAHDTGQNFWIILIMIFAVFAIVQSIQDGYLTPRIMGNVTGLNAAVIFLSLSIWGSLLGFIGLIIALPLTTLLVSYYKRYVLEEVESKASTGDTAEAKTINAEK